MATKISAYSENNRFFLCFEDCDPETAKKVGDFVLNVLKVPVNNTVGFVVDEKEALSDQKNPLDFPVLGTSGTLDVAIKRNDAKSVINTLVKNKGNYIPDDTMKEIKCFLLSYVYNIEKQIPFKNNGEALIYIQTLQPLCIKAIKHFLASVSPDGQIPNLPAYFEADIKNAHNLLLKYMIDDLKNRLD